MKPSDQEEKRQAKLKPAIVSLYKITDTLDCINNCLFDLPLASRLALKSHEQTAWTNVVTSTVRQSKAEPAGLIAKMCGTV
jgi:hypothetical protein